MEERKIAIVTGASRGIGRATAVELAKAGYYVVVNYNSSEAAAAETLAQVQAAGAQGEVQKFDVANADEVKEALARIVGEHKRIDVLVNNAGITRDKLIMRMDEEDFDATYQVNLKGTFNMIRHALPLMLKQRAGSIINISSVVGETGNTGQANYAASKAGIIGLTKSVAREAATRGITCNAIAPGFIETEMTDVLSEKIQEQMLTQIPLKRFGKAEEVANTAVFLSENTYITGQTISVNGGMYM